MKIVPNLVKVYFCLLFLLLLSSTTVVAAEDLGGVSGSIDCRGSTGCSGLVVLWQATNGTVPDPRRFTIPPAVVSPLQTDGSFVLEATPGDYFLGAFERNTPGPLMGPPRIGDLIYLTPNPAGDAQKVTVIAGQKTNAGNHSAAWTFKGMTEPAETRISGQVLDKKFRPVPGLLVFAFADADLSTSPQAVSNRTDTDGRFILPLPKPGKVYLRVRKNYQGGQPQPADYVGVYGGRFPKALTLAEGQKIKEVRIQVLQVPELMKKKNASGTSRPQLNN